MEIEGKSIMILGGWGQVGKAVGRALIPEYPRKIIISSLAEEQAKSTVEELKNISDDSGIEFAFFGGNILFRADLKNKPASELLADHENRSKLIEDIFGKKHNCIAKKSLIYKQFEEYKPDIVIDCINTATALAYQSVYDNVENVRRASENPNDEENLTEAVEKLVCTLYVPQLLRHVQTLYNTMKEFKTKMYIKIGTSGTGGMGLNIPYTHSEEKPSNVLLSKSAIGGAHTLLLYLMARTPDAPIVKEIKPTTAICWKEINYGPVLRKREKISLHDCPLSKAFILEGELEPKDEDFSHPIGSTLESVYIDTGENGQFSLGEFSAITMLGQMEFVTPEEIASIVVSEIKGGNTGHDLINAFDAANLGPTYRAGFLRNYALEAMRKIECDHSTESVAFENLGPPRLSKLLYEAYLLKQCCHTLNALAACDAETLSGEVENFIVQDADLRARIISIGIPILLKDGKRLLRGPEIHIPPNKGDNAEEITDESIEDWAKAGWVDLREKNMQKWIDRAKKILDEEKKSSSDQMSSQFERGEWFWNSNSSFDIGEVVGWIFIVEDRGRRMKR